MRLAVSPRVESRWSSSAAFPGTGGEISHHDVRCRLVRYRARKVSESIGRRRPGTPIQRVPSTRSALQRLHPPCTSTGARRERLMAQSHVLTSAEGPPMSTYPNIADHGLIGDLQTAALVSTDASVDWFCAPRFDSPTVFGALLDAERGGHCTVSTSDPHITQQLYLPDTAVLVTRFLSERGVGEVIDFMPLSGDTATDRHRIVRVLACVRGQIDFSID